MHLVRQITYEAKDDAEAMVMARERLGRDAVIISSRVVKRGGFLGLFRRRVLEVTAGLFEEDRQQTPEEAKDRILAFQRLLEVKQAVKEVLPDPEKSEPTASPAPQSFEGVELQLSNRGRQLAAGVPMAVPITASRVPEPEDDAELKRQVGEIHQALERVLSRLEEEKKAGPAARSGADRENVKMLLDADVTMHHALELDAAFDEDKPGVSFATWLSGRIPVLGRDATAALAGRRVMFIGPTGVGKTTTIAKLAAIHSLWERKRVLMLTADTFRIAAVEQLRTYARILGVPFEVVFDPQEVPEVLGKYEDLDLILLDTAGRSQRDGKRLDELLSLHRAFRPDAVHLVAAANMKYRDMLDVVDRMGVVPITGLLFTKLDETMSYGNLLNAALDFDKPISFVTTGQNVPNDIEVANADMIARLVAGGERVGR